MKAKSSKIVRVAFVLALPLALTGCAHPKITAVDLSNPNDKVKGIPYYLPKPYLIITKNVRYIPTPTIGLTQTAPIPDAFDASGSATQPPQSNTGNTNKTNQADKTGKPVTANNGQDNSVSTNVLAPLLDSQSSAESPGGSPKSTTANNATSDPQDGSNSPPASTQVTGPASLAVVPPASIQDGLTPDTFYTYQIIYLPDLTQKYGLRVKGGYGEMRATLNIVNGWMFTGPGPVYFRDSFTSENVASYGTTVSGILDSASKFTTAVYGGPPGAVASSLTSKGPGGQSPPPPTFFVNSITNYAEIWVYESIIENNKMAWQLDTNFPLALSREYLATNSTDGLDQ